MPVGVGNLSSLRWPKLGDPLEIRLRGLPHVQSVGFGDLQAIIQQAVRASESNSQAQSFVTDTLEEHFRNRRFKLEIQFSTAFKFLNVRVGVKMGLISAIIIILLLDRLESWRVGLIGLYNVPDVIIQGSIRNR